MEREPTYGPKGEHSRTLLRARTHFRAVSALVPHEEVPMALIADHWRRGWAALRKAHSAVEDGRADDVLKLDRGGQFLAATRAEKRVARLLGAAAIAGTPYRAIAVWGAAALAAVVLASTLWVPAPPEGPWLGVYRSPEIRRHDRDINFDWGKGPALLPINRDRINIDWYVCWVVDAPIEVELALSADDRASVLVDGDKVVSAKQRVPGRGRVSLGRGVHTVRVVFRERSGGASITLRASVDGGPLGPIPQSSLRAPAEDGTCPVDL